MLGPDDADDTDSSWPPTSRERGPRRRLLDDLVDLQVQIDAIGLGAVYALMAVGIGLVFGVLRLVNFAYGQLIMAGAFALALASEWDWPVWAGIVLCFAVVLALSAAMEWLDLPAVAAAVARR